MHDVRLIFRSTVALSGEGSLPVLLSHIHIWYHSMQTYVHMPRICNAIGTVFLVQSQAHAALPMLLLLLLLLKMV